MKNESKQSLTAIILALGFAVIALAIIFAPQPDVNVTTGGEGATQRNTISVRGEAQFETFPDQAEMYIRVKTDEATANQAQEQNARLMNTVKAALKKAGVSDDDMESTSYNLWPQQKWDRDREEYDITGYTAQHLLKITTDDVTDVGRLLDVAVKNGANGLDRVSFSLSDSKEEDVNSESLAQASSNARDKAEAIAQGLGVRLGDIVAVSESNVGYNYYAAPKYAMAESMGSDSRAFDTEISPENVNVDAYMNIVYEIKQ
ncbi:SIMPL domain-containing protein [Candidatus Woesearchaeota archaeon]|nr:SIMPL domain-containing protein [Candidatus Woesearchaeota archaeon]